MFTGKIMKHRRVKHYGFEFRYDNNNVDKDKPLSEKIPEDCLFINKRLEEKGYGTLLPWTPDQLTVNQYQKGQGNNLRLFLKTFMDMTNIAVILVGQCHLILH